MRVYCCKFIAFLAFCRKNAENDYFNQCLECAAPKRWSKYTTTSFKQYSGLLHAKIFVAQILLVKFKLFCSKFTPELGLFKQTKEKKKELERKINKKTKKFEIKEKTSQQLRQSFCSQEINKQIKEKN